MCRAISEDGVGRRCNKHNSFGQQLTNTQARRQYTLRRLKQTHLSDKQREKLEAVLEETTNTVEKLKSNKEALGYGLTPYTMNLSPECETVLTTLEEAGFKPFIVGGSVRDALLGLPQKDIDIEVYGGQSEDVTKALETIGKVDAVGEAFGVLKIRIGKEDFDVSLPRKDSKVGDGHTGFDIEVDPNLSLEEASARRDFTINALMYNHSLGYIVDKHDGLKDMESKTLRHVSDAFDEDPLRVLRGVQMASRFGFNLHPDTIVKANSLKDEYNQLARERVQIEFQKLYEKGKHPHKALKLLKETGWEDNFPGLKEANTKALRKDAKRVQKSFDKFNIPAEKRPELLGAVIIRHINPKQQRDFLSATMVGDNPKNAAYNLANTVAPQKLKKADLRAWAYNMPRNVTIRDWVHLEYAAGDRDKAMAIYEKAGKLGILDAPEKDLISGHDLLQAFPDRKPGRWLRPALDQLREAQYKGEFRNKDKGLKYMKRQIK